MAPSEIKAHAEESQGAFCHSFVFEDQLSRFQFDNTCEEEFIVHNTKFIATNTYKAQRLCRFSCFARFVDVTGKAWVQ